MLNARERLAQISHHFLSDTEAHVAGTAAEVCMAILEDPDDPGGLPVDLLARSLAARGRVVSVVDRSAGLVSFVHRIEPAAGDDLPHGAKAHADRMTTAAGRVDTVLVIGGLEAPDRAAGYAGRCDSVLLALPCDPPGMRRAYARVKPLMAGPGAPALGVTVTGAADCVSAEACFDRFARGCRKFLGINPASYAWLGTAGDARHQAAEIAELLLEDWARRHPMDHAVN